MIITIVIPVKNRLNDLKRCLESLKEATQTQIIVIDDHSNQPITSIINKEFPSVEVFVNEGNGVGQARNTGIARVKTPYIMFVDSDDVLLPGWEAVVLNDITNNTDSDVLVYPPTSLKDEAVGDRHLYLEKLIKDYLEDPSELRLALIKFRGVSIIGKVYKTSVINEHRISFGHEIIGEDVMFTTKIGLKANDFFVSEQVWYVISQNENSHNMQQSKASWKTRLNLVVEQAALIKKNIDPQLFKQLHFPVKHYLSRALKGGASWVDIAKYIVQARKLGIW